MFELKILPGPYKLLLLPYWFIIIKLCKIKCTNYVDGEPTAHPAVLME